MQMDPEKVEAILRWLTPKDLQIFLGMYHFYQQYVRDYAKISFHMTDQLQLKSKEISWGEPKQKSFKKLKVDLIVAPILDIVDPNKLIVLKTDANGEAIGVVLM